MIWEIVKNRKKKIRSPLAKKRQTEPEQKKIVFFKKCRQDVLWLETNDKRTEMWKRDEWLILVVFSLRLSRSFWDAILDIPSLPICFLECSFALFVFTCGLSENNSVSKTSWPPAMVVHLHPSSQRLVRDRCLAQSYLILLLFALPGLCLLKLFSPHVYSQSLERPPSWQQRALI